MEWKAEYPKLYMLFEDSDRLHPDNYFSLMENLRTRRHGKETYDKWEKILSELDKDSLKKIIKKASKYVSIRDSNRGWGQLFNSLNETHGYIYLKDEGYSNIAFIDEGDNSKPDLFGKSEGKTALLEVKTIQKSDIDIKRDQVWKGTTIIPEGLQKKLKCVIEKATTQLNTDMYSVDSKYIYMIISLDLALDLIKENRAFLERYVNSLIDDDILIEVLFQTG